MNNEEKQVAAGQFVVTVGEGGSDLPDYEVLPAEEPIKANIVDLKEVPGMWPDESGNLKQQLKFSIKIAEGEKGAGQTYGYWVNAPTSNFISPKSGVYKVVSKVFPDLPENMDIYSTLGQPIRIELSEPYPSKKNPDKAIQRVTAIKSPTKDQKPVKVNTDVVPTEVPTDAEAALTEVFGPNAEVK